MSPLARFLTRGAVAGVVGAAALWVPSVAGASAAAPSAASAAWAPPVFPMSGTLGPITYWAVLPYGAGFVGPNSNCSFQTTDSLILPPHAQCTVNGHQVGVYFFPSGPVFVLT